MKQRKLALPRWLLAAGQKLKTLWGRPVPRCLMLSLAAALVIDILNMRSPWDALLRLLTNPLLFLFNAGLVLLFVTLSCFFRRRSFALVMSLFPWFVVTGVNFVLQCLRKTPFSLSDFLLTLSILPIMDFYMSPLGMAAAIAGVLAAIAFLVVLFFRSRKRERNVRAGLTLLCGNVLFLAAAAAILFQSGLLAKDYGNLHKAYRDYGLPYCFIMSCVDRGIERPEDYSDETINDLVSGIEENLDKAPAVPAVQGNVIFLQLESFLDTDHLLNLSSSEAATPCFQQLKEQYPSGYLTVPTFGAGTVNTEFEVLSGMSLLHFGAGEYPYNSVLRTRTCETVAYNLKTLGYTATAIHNNNATFYDRNVVFSNLGFDRFISLEFMQEPEYNSIGWAKDINLQEEILRAMDSTPGRDLVYTISVQPHGDYPKKSEDVADLPIRVTMDGSAAEAELAAATYYVNQLREVDDFLRSLTEELSTRAEPTMLVIFGDHLPNFRLEEQDMLSGDLYKTEYVIWSNYPLELEDVDLNAWQLSAHVLRAVGCRAGVINPLHQSRRANENYDGLLELLEYDLLFGDVLVYHGETPYAPTQLQMGFGDLRMESVTWENGVLSVRGTGFTDFASIFVDGSRLRNSRLEDGILRAETDRPKSGEEVTVEIVAKDGTILAASEKYLWP